MVLFCLVISTAPLLGRLGSSKMKKRERELWKKQRKCRCEVLKSYNERETELVVKVFSERKEE